MIVSSPSQGDSALLTLIPAYIGEQGGELLGAGPDLIEIVRGVIEMRNHRVAAESGFRLPSRSDELTGWEAFALADRVLARSLERRAHSRAIEAREFLEELDDE